MCGPSAFPQGTSRDLVGREADEAAHFNQLNQLRGHCCCLSMSRENPLFLPQFAHSISFPLTCFKTPALVPADSEGGALGRLPEGSLSQKRKQLRRKTQGGYGNTWMLQMQTKLKCLLKSRRELSVGRALGAVAGRMPALAGRQRQLFDGLSS